MDIPVVHHRDQLLARGFTDHELRSRRRRGELTAIRPGAYLQGTAPDSGIQRHLLMATAARRELAGDTVFSHVTAAALHALPIWGIPLNRIHITRARRTGGRVGRLIHLHTARLEPDETAATEVLVTSVARTVLDLARTVPFEQAVAVADAALHGKLVTPQELTDAVSRAARWPGAPAARRVVAFADGRSDNVGESRSRVAIQLAGLPAPIPQWNVLDQHGRWQARSDFGWPTLRTVGEFDGRVKYQQLLRPGQSATDVVLDEKRREDRIRATGLAVVRWDWADLDTFADVADALRHQFRQG